ncbi:MAG TPA: hypothetical protein ENF67_01555 [Candidatus Pacearchaeota archaeon]|nr:hypothetical protein [Candidatus Pacearchaeota archaeon]
MKVYELIDIVIPNYTKRLSELLTYLEIKPARQRVASLIYFSLLFSLFVAVFFYIIFYRNLFSTFTASLIALATFIGLFFIIILLFYLVCSFRVDLKASSVEAVFPDALALMATNLRAGLTTEQALFSSARREFGYLRKELTRVAREVNAGKRIDEALYDMSRRIRSPVVERHIHLIITGLRSGGELARLLEEASAHLREVQIAKKQMSTSVLSYVIFIIIAIGIASPLLLSLVSRLAEVFSELYSTIEIPNITANVPMLLPSQLTLDPMFFRWIALALIIANATIGSFIVGALSTGNEKTGIKYLPIFLALGIGIFYVVRILISKIIQFIV